MLNRKLLSLFGLRPTGDFGPWTFYTSKAGLPVWFVKAPPTSPPTERQSFIRWKLGIFGSDWTHLPNETKKNWETATKRTGLKMTGYNLWQWWHWHSNINVMRTIERQSGVTLVP